MIIELLSAGATAAASTGSAMAAFSGDSLTVRASRSPRILALWAAVQTAGWLQLIFPSAHDTSRNIRTRTTAALVDLLHLPPPIEVQSQELLALTLAENAVAGDVGTAHLLMGYDVLPGVQQRLIDNATLRSRLDKFLTIDCSITSVAGPGYSGEEVLTSESDLLQGNREYAVLGARPSVRCGAVTLRGPDFGNLRIGVPGEPTMPRMTNYFFPMLAASTGLGCIPVFNSANKGSTFIGVSQDENAAAVTVSINLALLK